MARPDLSTTRLYLCTDARESTGDLEGFVEEALSAGVDAVQLRQKGLEAAVELGYLARIAAVAARHGALVAANDRADIAHVAHTDLLHLGQDDLPVHAARQIVGPDVAIGLSTHDPAQVDAALANEDVDYFSVGPVWPTPTKPGRPAPGLELIRYAAAAAGQQRPWFAIGGIDLQRLDQVLDAGARRVVVVRAITTAPDPRAAAAAFASRLRGR